MENKKMYLTPDGPQELDESLLKGVTGGTSEEDWDIKLPYKYKIGQLVHIPILNDGAWEIRERWRIHNANLNMYTVRQDDDREFVGEVMILPIA